MHKGQCKNTISNRKGTMAPTEPRYSTAARAEHLIAAEAQKHDLENKLLGFFSFCWI